MQNSTTYILLVLPWHALASSVKGPSVTHSAASLLVEAPSGADLDRVVIPLLRRAEREEGEAEAEGLVLVVCCSWAVAIGSGAEAVVFEAADFRGRPTLFDFGVLCFPLPLLDVVEVDDSAASV